MRTTGSFAAEREFDGKRVAALLNLMRGLDGAGAAKVGVPALFGMNFQAVSLGQKLPKAGPGDAPGLKGGYADAAGQLLSGLKENGLDGSTLVIVSAKHGHAPIDPEAYRPIDDKPLDAVPGHAFHVADDDVLLWLKPSEREARLPDALAALERDRKALGIGAILPPAAVASLFADPATGSRASDNMVGTAPGIVCTSGKKAAEHGGMGFDDRNVALVVAGPGVKPAVVAGPAGTARIAPTILKALGCAPEELRAVKAEGTPALPGLPF